MLATSLIDALAPELAASNRLRSGLQIYYVIVMKSVRGNERGVGGIG